MFYLLGQDSYQLNNFTPVECVKHSLSLSLSMCIYIFTLLYGVLIALYPSDFIREKSLTTSLYQKYLNK